jgi:hypothetical protein
MELLVSASTLISYGKGSGQPYKIIWKSTRVTDADDSTLSKTSRISLDRENDHVITWLYDHRFFNGIMATIKTHRTLIISSY